MMFLKAWFTAAVVLLTAAVNAQNFDIDLLKSINENESSFKTDFSKTVTQSVIIVNIAAPVTLLTVGLATHDKKLQKDAAYMAGGYILSTIITQGTKRIMQRARPYEKYPFIINRVNPEGYSFPSGHTSSAFYSATSLSLLYKKWYVVVPSYAWAVSVGYARMYQGVHYPSDVFVGALIGAGSAWAAYKIQKWMDKKAAAQKAVLPVGL
ncbi:MAG: phosphatase PAP2 family protein [Chitinophagaceae bacterium]|nr:phosphatase PAP2 family protein [Chitinophagaceae bacterium]